ncbi:hypothetical protein BV911_05305 [Pseudoruegeria sp. SK021]|nr:hypothetical protein BV911_05305 [Pseudoruegeria sp. SK021]
MTEVVGGDRGRRMVCHKESPSGGVVIRPRRGGKCRGIAAALCPYINPDARDGWTGRPAVLSGARAMEFTPSRDGDSPILPDLPGQIAEVDQIGTVAAVGAFDTRSGHTAIIDRQGLRETMPAAASGRGCAI